MEPPSSPPPEGAESFAWYKLQYEQLEAELAEFRDSSRELEAELEKDIEMAEKRERTLKERAESLTFEVEEWKRKYKESKAEASAAQATLEKEITSLRNANRTVQLRLREIEVANDDYERQARNTTSSLEDMESKYNQVIERGVLLEEEMKISEMEREQMRIETQRLKEELNEMKIEAELLQDKVKSYEHRNSVISTDISVSSSPMFDKNDSTGSTASSPLISTPPDSDLPPVDPPSPPMSDASGAQLPKTRAPLRAPTMTKRSRLPSISAGEGNPLPKPRSKTFSSSVNGRPPTSSGNRQVSSANLKAPPSTSARHTSRTSASSKPPPASNSLSHIRSLTAQMQRLEARVHSARSKLPAPSTTPPRGPSPRDNHMPLPIMTRPRNRTLTSTASSVVSDDSATSSSAGTRPPTQASVGRTNSNHVPRLSSSSTSGRFNFTPLAPRSRNTNTDTDTAPSLSRASSRTSASSSLSRAGSRAEMTRPMTRPVNTSRPPLTRPRTTTTGGYHHTHSLSLSKATLDLEEADGRSSVISTTRRGAYSTRFDFSGSVDLDSTGIPLRAVMPTRKLSSARRLSSSIPTANYGGSNKMSELEETY
ncbi:hypothetical protein TD95_000782 [Thielaviopsis punctulata]|uniref:NUDE domain-containing protein n=1 Tax=Thielaviopsis punctulata TaxID=72032 RepID=A0A0F4Z905_9PEZI|nr:hypothetical protein TD95_000782 [Thielaviopsis punctulata]